MTVVAPVLRSLVHGLVDYAGLFPPAALAMPEAVANFAAYHASDDAWVLGRFVVPASRLAEFAAAAEPLAPQGAARPWLVSLLAARPGDCAVAEAFNAQWEGRARIDVMEGKAGSPDEVRALAAAAAPGIALYVELGMTDQLVPCLQALHVVGASAKIRTGGVTVEAFPPAGDIVRFVRACHEAGVSFKATAGLHHPVRGTYRLTYAADSPQGPMYGYLNLLLASAAIAGGGTDGAALRLLQAEGSSPITIAGDVVEWAGVTTTVTASVRMFLRGIGSCSFREPVDELLTLSLATA